MDHFLGDSMNISKVVINLDRSSERWNNFLSVNDHLTNIERYPAIDGASVDRDRLVADRLLLSNNRYSNNVLGCALSHLSLWQRCVTNNETMTVFEDDCIVSEHFEDRTELLISQLDKWDFIAWGYSPNLFLWLDALGGLAPFEIRWSQKFREMEYGEFQKSTPDNVLMRLRHYFGAVCYTITPSGARAFLNHCLPLRDDFIDFPFFGIRNQDMGIDCPMNEVYSQIHSFISVGPIVLPNEIINSTLGEQEERVTNHS